GIAAPFCAKLLSDLGADTIKVEPPQGDYARRLGPFPGGSPDAERSATFFYLNTGKKSIVLDVHSDQDRITLAQLVQTYDIVISDQCEERLAEQGLDYASLQAWNPDVILTSVSGFGSFGPHSAYESSHLINCAQGGWAQLCGVPEREPLQSGGAITETLTGAYAATATLLAAFGRLRHGHGEHVDVSAQQAVLCGAQIPSLIYEYKGAVVERYSSVGSGAGAGYMLPTREGVVGLNALTPPQWHMLCKFLGRPDIAEDEYFQGLSWTTPDSRLEEIREIFRAALSDKTAEQLFHEAQKKRVPFGLVPDLQGLMTLAPHIERGFYQTVTHPIAGRVQVPGIPFKSNVTTVTMLPPPLLDEHRQSILDELEEVAANPRPQTETVTDLTDTNPLPLEGLRVVDMSMFFAGPAAAQICADAGADVIKIESIQRIDGWRGSGTVDDSGLASWEASPYFNWINRNKRDITLNLTDPRGVAAAKKLIAQADLLIENYTPRVMQNFGLSYDELKEINPRLIMISLSGFGADVSWRDYVAFGMSTEQMSGVAHLTGYTGAESLYTGMTGGDLFSGVMGAVDLLAALHLREATGLGQHLDFSQMEACNMFVGDAMTGWTLAGYDPGRTGNQHPTYVVQGVYPCSDGWIALSLKHQAHLDSVCELINCSSKSVPTYAQLAAWTEGFEKIELTKQLQALGVPAGAVLNGPELLADPQLAARGAYLAQDRPGLGVKHYPNQPYQFKRIPHPPTTRAPLLGEHLEEVLTQEVGLDAEEIVQLVIDDVIGTVPIEAR
ncbi:MAG: crotonobetainyl-CoA:carnitine CoA-transferase CaiB-like acyl-CoA transferase, partial [Candidatus Azotimanducaceae bacterium]